MIKTVTTSKPWYENTILRIAALLGALSAIVTSAKGLFSASDFFNAENIRLLLVILNFLALAVFCFLLTRIPQLTFKEPLETSIDKYIKLLSIEAKKNLVPKQIVVNNCERVNVLTTQLNNNILGYSFFLILVYGLYIFDDKTNPLFFKTAEDICNFISSVFLYLAFKVLYDQTLDESNRRIVYYVDALFFSLVYICAYLIISFKMGSPPVWVHNLSLLSGVFNGLAMGLLFGRFISMEFVFKYQEKIKLNSFLSLGTVFILPLYVLAQPLFGSFEINSFGDPKIFANVVFFICLIGKVFFLYLYYYFLSKKLLHLYLHLISSRPKVLKDLDDIFD